MGRSTWRLSPRCEKESGVGSQETGVRSRETGVRIHETVVKGIFVLDLHPSPPWGRGWRATGAFISRGETGEGVKSCPADATTSLYLPYPKFSG